MKELILPRGVNLLVFDYIGCGLSEGEYISLGWNEKDDLKILVDYAKEMFNVSAVGLWGRSMGVSTSLRYLKDNQEHVKAAVLDSGFSKLSDIMEHMGGQLGLGFLYDMMAVFVKKHCED